MRRIFLLTALSLLSLGVQAQGTTSASAWPNKPVRLVTAFGAGSASDIVARTIAVELQHRFGQPVVVDNKPGASGIIASELVARAAPDGYTLILTTNTTHSVNPYLFAKLPYDPVRDFTPIVRVCYFPFVLAVNATTSVHSVQDLMHESSDPKHKTNYGYGNSTGQIAGAAFNSLAKLNATAVPYKSSPQALTDLMGGQVDFLFTDLASSQSHFKSGRLRALAVTTAQRSKLAPELPTLATSAGLPGFDLAAWVGVMAPAGLPPEIRDKLDAAITDMLARPEVIEKFTAIGAEVAPAHSADFATYLRGQLDAWGSKVKAAGITPE